MGQQWHRLTHMALVLALAACVAAPVLPTRSPSPNEPCNEQFVEPVTLRQHTSDPDSPVVAVHSDGTTMTLTWPKGFSATFDPLRIYDDSGAQIATDGSRVHLFGFGAGGAGPFHVCDLEGAS